MATEKFANKPITTLDGAIDGVVGSLDVLDASLFPLTSQFRILVESEYMLVTGVSGSTFTVTRGIEGSSNVPHASGAPVVHILTAGALDLFCQTDDTRLTDDRTASGLRTATTVVSISGATAPSSGQILVASSSTSAAWTSDTRLTDDRTASGLRTATTVVSISGATAPSAGQVLTASSGTGAAWSTPIPLASAAPANVTKATAAVGTGTTAARDDHKHDVTTAAPSTLAAGGSNTEGSATSLARSDHVHALPAYGTGSGTICQGNDSRLSDDRTASGLRTATTVVVVSAATAPSAGQVLTASSGTAAAWSTPIPLASAAPANVTKAAAAVGTGTTAARDDHKHDVTTAAPSTLAAGGSNTEGSATSLARSDHIHALPAYGTGSETICQGNDSRLSDDRTASGLRTATTIVVVSAATAPSNGQVLVASSGTAAAWQTIASPESYPGLYPADGGTLTIDLSGVITCTHGAHAIESNSGTTDDVLTINGVADGEKVILRALDTHTITLKNTGGNIQNLSADFVLDSTYDRVEVLGVSGGNVVVTWHVP